MAKREARKSSILSDQKPRQSKKKRRRRLRVYGMTAAGTLVLALASYGTWRLTKRAATPVRTLAPKNHDRDWVIDFAPDAESLLKAGSKKMIYDKIKDDLKSAQYPDLYVVARYLQEQTASKAVQLIQTDTNHLYVRVIHREPKLRVAAEKTRLVSEDGIVYGSAGEDHAELPLVTGLLDRRTKALSMKSDATLALSDDDEAALKEALSFFADKNAKDFGFNTLEYVDYRGFIARNGKWEVAIGRAPFQERFQKLQKIIADLEKKGVASARIELDYSDKAFVKQENM